MSLDTARKSACATRLARLRHGKQDTERGSSELAGHQQNIAASQQRTLAGDGKAQAHTSALERNRRLEERTARLRAEAGTGVMHFNSNLVAARRCHPQHDAARSDGLR